VREDACVILEAHFSFDRTRFGVLYGSGRFYEKLGMHLVHDEVMVRTRLITVPIP
jgi:hypothetical protein